MNDILKSKYWLWTLAIAITLSSVAFQRVTGPSYPVRVNQELPNGSAIKTKLLTTHVSTADAPVKIVVNDQIFSGKMVWRRVNSRDEWTTTAMSRSGDTLTASIPKQPPAGKIAYNVILSLIDGTDIKLTDDPVVMRFKGPVPIGVLAPHVFCMFVSMLLATATGLKAAAKIETVRPLAIATAILLFAGGLVLGPIVQKYAFGAYWTGWPLGHDLTDNKTALAMLMWVIAIWRNSRTRTGRWWYVAAALVHLLVYLIPHSVLGSELDYGDQPSR